MISVHKIVFEPDIEDEPIIDFYNKPKVPNDEDEPSSDTPKIPIISNVVDCTTRTSNDKNLCSTELVHEEGLLWELLWWISWI